MKKSLLLLSLFSIICSGIYAQDAQTAPKNATGPQLYFTVIDSSYDLGVIPLGSSIENEIEIKNTGDEPLLISDVKSDSKYIQCKWPSRLKPGKKAYLTIAYTAHGESGSFGSYIHILSNAPGSLRTVRITGANTPGGTYMPASTPSSKSGGRHGH